MTEKRLDYDLLWNNYYQVIELDDEDTDYLRRLSPTEIIKRLNEQQATNDYLEESNSRLQVQLGETLRLVDEQQATITELAKKWRVLSQENMQLKDYIDTIFEDNTHICKYLDVEDVQFYCDKNKNYRNPSCLYEKCFDEENLIKIKDEIRRVLE